MTHPQHHHDENHDCASSASPRVSNVALEMYGIERDADDYEDDDDDIDGSPCRAHAMSPICKCLARAPTGCKPTLPGTLQELQLCLGQRKAAMATR